MIFIFINFSFNIISKYALLLNIFYFSACFAYISQQKYCKKLQFQSKSLKILLKVIFIGRKYLQIRSTSTLRATALILRALAEPPAATA